MPNVNYYFVLVLTSRLLKEEFHIKGMRGRAWWLMPVIQTHWEAKVGKIVEAGSSRPAWPTWWNSVSTNDTKISQEWWCTLVIPATWEAEVGGPLEQMLQWAMIAPLYSKLGNRAKPCLQKKGRPFLVAEVLSLILLSCVSFRQVT